MCVRIFQNNPCSREICANAMPKQVVFVKSGVLGFVFQCHQDDNGINIFLCDSDIQIDRLDKNLKGSITRCSVEAMQVSYWKI